MVPSNGTGPVGTPNWNSSLETEGMVKGVPVFKEDWRNPHYFLSPLLFHRVALEVDSVMRSTQQHRKTKTWRFSNHKTKKWVADWWRGWEEITERRELEKGKLGCMKEVPGAHALMCALSPMCARVKLTQSNLVRALRTWLRVVRTGSWELPSWAGLMELQRLWKLDWQWNCRGQVRTRTLKLAGWIACFENQPTNTLPRILTGTECHNRTLERSTIQSKITWYMKDQGNANNFQDKRQTSTNSKMT